MGYDKKITKPSQPEHKLVLVNGYAQRNILPYRNVIFVNKILSHDILGSYTKK
jgi:hypothetical protein